MNPIRGSLENNCSLRLSRSIKKDLYLPPIHKQLTPTPLANFQTARQWSNSTKGLIAKEWDNLQRIKERGTLAPKYTVLPPIAHKTLINGEAGLHPSVILKESIQAMDKSQHVNQLKKMIELTTESMDEPTQQSHKDLKQQQQQQQQQKQPRRNRRNEYKQQGNGSCDKDDTTPTNTTNKSRKKSDTNSVQLPHIATRNSTTPETKETTTTATTATITSKSQNPKEKIELPKIFSPDNSKSKRKEQQQLESKFNEDMITWAIHQGRRNAICKEMDPLFEELSSIIKYNLLVQHLEDIWMC